MILKMLLLFLFLMLVSLGKGFQNINSKQVFTRLYSIKKSNFEKKYIAKSPGQVEYKKYHKLRNMDHRRNWYKP